MADGVGPQTVNDQSQGLLVEVDKTRFMLVMEPSLSHLTMVSAVSASSRQRMCADIVAHLCVLPCAQTCVGSLYVLYIWVHLICL